MILYSNYSILYGTNKNGNRLKQLPFYKIWYTLYLGFVGIIFKIDIGQVMVRIEGHAFDGRC